MEKESQGPDEQQSAKALAYLKGEMSEPERDIFEQMLTESEALREEVVRSRQILDSIDATRDDAVVRIVNDQITQAITRGASDIHLVPQRRSVMVSCRIDGYLQEVSTLAKEHQQAVIDRWKLMADMNLAERSLPQDGRIPLKHNKADYDLRVSILPTLYGERLTARILSEGGVLLGFDHLRLSPAPLAALKRLSRLGAGLILTTGQTGVGKTTLLYSLLQEIRTSGRGGQNILTIEDPVEFGFDLGISQTGVNRRMGLTYAAALRGMLRSDPDVILCAEMRDLETAELTAEIALTGHLILSALHTTSALGAIQRLRDIGIENFLIADIVAGLIGQRLVRRIDTGETEEYEPDTEELERAGLTKADGPFLRGVPSDSNGGTGFKGRIPLVEVVEVTPVLRRLIAERASDEALWRAAFAKNAGSLRDDARSRVRAGLTTVEEVNWALFDYPDW
ncbi:MAG: ATPase, T2SS/T4P/T4SS family [Armatimonadota bacterium]